MSPNAGPEIDKDALKAKYRRERDKRLRPDGNAQYQRLSGRFAHYAVDPYLPVEPRDPITDDVAVAIIGGGFAGLLTGARLAEAGVTDVRIVDKGGDFGGTWYWNRYPGAQCDTASMVYMPLLEETGHMPTEKYAGSTSPSCPGCRASTSSKATPSTPAAGTTPTPAVTPPVRR